ncbi:unnamed protein product [Hymenolepis diminuta]|uniref:Uncharacterized protein n=1 Tax=Hymenolepis diminuta TaxID=6216 RepID=A0A564ZD46_HYMDI|nr:unnamed protein product [Hymenolepis diminuta]
MLWRGLTQVTHIKLLLFFQTTHTGQCGLLHITLLSLSLLLIVASLNTFWSAQLLVLCFTNVVNSYSNSYELVVVIC